MATDETKIRPLVAGNWKMNGLSSALGEAEAVAASLGQGGWMADALICPPSTLLAPMAARLAGSVVAVGGQDCHTAASGAHTGDVSAEMLRDAGASAVIVGHSERRSDHGETDLTVRSKAAAAHRAGLAAIVCVGETAGERRAGLTLGVVGRQLAASLPASATASNTVVAYEPVWAIGTGLTPTLADVAEVHRFLRGIVVERLGDTGRSLRLLYGGSVKPANAGELLRVGDVDGALVGGASLTSKDFLGILSVYRT
jgi:triosephosphate isomerase